MCVMMAVYLFSLIIVVQAYHLLLGVVAVNGVFARTKRHLQFPHVITMLVQCQHRGTHSHTLLDVERGITLHHGKLPTTHQAISLASHHHLTMHIRIHLQGSSRVRVGQQLTRMVGYQLNPFVCLCHTPHQLDTRVVVEDMIA